MVTAVCIIHALEPVVLIIGGLRELNTAASNSASLLQKCNTGLVTDYTQPFINGLAKYDMSAICTTSQGSQLLKMALNGSRRPKE